MEEAVSRYPEIGIAEAVQDIILVVDLNGKIIKANEAASITYGYTREELRSMSIFDLRAPETAHLVYAQMEQASSEGIVFETRHRCKDGRLVPVEVSSRRVMISNKPVLLSAIRDISERTSREAELRKLSVAVEQSPVSVVITDLKGNIEYVNPKFIQVTGYALHETIGQNPRILKSGVQPTEVYKELWEAITSGREWQGEFHNKKKNGELYWELATISPIRNTAGEITHFIAVKEDITERKKADAALTQAHAELNQIIESSGDGICVVGLDANVIRANSAFALMCNKDSEELVGLKACDVFPGCHCGTARCSMQRILRGEAGFEFDQELVDEAVGRKRHWLVTVNPFYDAAGKLIGLVKNYKEITERVRVQEAMQRDLQLAGRIQRGFLPGRVDSDLMMIDAIYEPYHHVSGDVVDFVWDEQRKVLTGYVIDVMGHGIGTALQTSALRVLFRQAVDRTVSPKEVMAWINREAAPYFAEDSFAAAFYFEFNFADRVLTYSAAGINYFLAFTEDKQGIISIPGPFLGVVDSVEYEEHQLKFQAGSHFHFMSDGIFDLLSPYTQFDSLAFDGIRSFLAQIAKNTKRSDDASALCIYIK
jgi:PAS domain S-box-containing protein